MVALIGVNVPNSIDTLLASAAQTASGVSASMDGFAPASNLVVQLNITAASGTTPTLDVKLQDTVDGTNWNDIPGTSFTQATAAGISVVRIATPFSSPLRVKYTIAGTTPSFTFGVTSYCDR